MEGRKLLLSMRKKKFYGDNNKVPSEEKETKVFVRKSLQTVKIIINGAF